MGNTFGGRKTATIMKINGEKFKLKTPVKAVEALKDYPGHVLLESEAVKRFGIRAEPLEPWRDLKPKRLYFLVDLPKFDRDEKVPRRVRSGINMTAKDRLESLMLSRRTVSDLSSMKPRSIEIEETKEGAGRTGSMRVKMRLPKAEVAKLMMESRDDDEAAEKIVRLCLANKPAGGGGHPQIKGGDGSLSQHRQLHWKGGFKAREGIVSYVVWRLTAVRIWLKTYFYYCRMVLDFSCRFSHYWTKFWSLFLEAFGKNAIGYHLEFWKM